MPGWFPDPAGAAATYRWWDGAGWTRWLSSSADAGPPPAGVGADVATPTPPVPDPTERLVRLPVAVSVLAAAVVLALVVVGAVASASASRLPSGPAVAPPAPAPVAAVSYDAGTRAAALAELRLTLPAAPYTCGPDPQELLPTLSTAVVCSAPVHDDYDGAGHDWTATAGLGVVPDPLVVPGDLEATAGRVFGSLRGQFFSGQSTTVAKQLTQPTGVAPDGRALLITGEVHYRVAHVASAYDRVLIAVVELRSGGYGAVFSSRPDDSSKATRTALDAALSSTSAR